MAVTRKSRTLLVVDDEPLFLASVTQALAESLERVEVLGAENGRAAANVLARRKVHLVVTDLEMPEENGFALLARLVHEYPGTPAIVMTAYGTPDIEEGVRKLGAIGYIDKPIDLATLTQAIRDALAPAGGGHIEGITLASFLQLLQLERKTCSVELRADGRFGVVHMIDGVVVDASVGHLVGDAAVLELASWDQPEIDLDAVCRSRTVTVKQPLTHLLLEAARLSDEADRDHGEAVAAISSGALAVACDAARLAVAELQDESAFAVALSCEPGFEEILSGDPADFDWAEDLRGLARSGLALAGPGPGSLEVVRPGLGVGVVWDQSQSVVIAVVTLAAGPAEISWFRSRFAAVSRCVVEMAEESHE